MGACVCNCAAFGSCLSRRRRATQFCVLRKAPGIETRKHTQISKIWCPAASRLLLLMSWPMRVTKACKVTDIPVHPRHQNASARTNRRQFGYFSSGKKTLTLDGLILDGLNTLPASPSLLVAPPGVLLPFAAGVKGLEPEDLPLGLTWGDSSSES